MQVAKQLTTRQPALAALAVCALLGCGSEQTTPSSNDTGGDEVATTDAGATDIDKPPDAPTRVSIAPTRHDFGNVAVGASSDPLVVRVINDGESIAGSLRITLVDDRGQFQLDADDCTGGELSAGESCEASFVFAPDVHGLSLAFIEVASEEKESFAQGVLAGVGIRPAELSLSPTTAHLGEVFVGEVGTPQSFRLENTGDESTDSVVVTLGGADPISFAVTADSCSGAPLTARGSCTISVAFAPSRTGETEANLEVDAGLDLPTTGLLQGLGLNGPHMYLTPSVHEFGQIPVGSISAAQTFILANTSGTLVGPIDVWLNGADPTHFTITRNECDGTFLPPQQICDIDVEFRPTAVGVRSADLGVQASTQTVVSALVGDAVAPLPAQLDIAPTSQSFGSVCVGDTSPTIAFVITNSGGAPSGVPTVAITGTDASQFQIGANTCTTALAAGVTCNVDVAFSPTTGGSKSADLTIAATPGGTVSASLSGTGLYCDPSTLPSPSLIDFGPVINGGASSSHTVTVTNTGGVTANAVSTTLSSPEFMDVNNGCNGMSLAPGATCTLDLEFHPTTAGTQQETLLVAYSGFSGHTVALVAESLPEFTTSPAGPIDFGDVPLNAFTEATVRITNTSGVGEVVRTVTASVTSGDFSITSNTCTAVAPGAACEVRVQFAPTGNPGARSDTLTLIDDTGATQTVDLTGNAI